MFAFYLKINFLNSRYSNTTSPVKSMSSPPFVVGTDIFMEEFKPSALELSNLKPKFGFVIFIIVS